MKVGFIGLGVIGGPMALNIFKGGHDLTVFDLNPEAVAQLTDAGTRRPPRRARSAPRARSS